MGLRCREGDQAIILAGPYIGFIVKVGKFVGTVHGSTPSGRPIAAKDVWEVINPHIKARRTDMRPCIQDRNLQPLRGPKTGQTTTTQKEMKA